ncbi:MAG TPA: amidohydrolase [Candidatus Acidoferrales bacterium]|nr:amidohydrolase [Candidatus Acidoferrales bacterium]
MTAPEAAQIDDLVIEWRRAIHREPELGFAEHKTSALVERELANAGIPSQRIAQTGVVGVLAGSRPGKTLLLRADMDALPIPERSGEPFASIVPGVMHACGHDAHTAMLLGAARWLAARRDQIAGTIKFVFQPAEEGPGGAKPMIEAGVLVSPKVDAAVMIHVLPIIPSGVIGWRVGPMQASADDFTIAILGRGGHAASPQLGVDTIPVAAELVTSLQRIASREVDPLAGVVVSIGTINGGYRRNVIADRTEIGGTIRCFSDELRESMPARLRRIADGIANAHGATVELDYAWGYPPVRNDERLTRLVAAIAQSTPGLTSVELPAPRMGAEDFAYFAQAVPGCMLRLGVAPPGEQAPAMLHSPQFRLDESALRSGVKIFCELALRLPQEL